MVRDYLVCEADFPSECVWIDRSKEPIPAGNELADALQAMLCDRTSKMSEIWNHEAHGWSFNCEWNRVTINVLVTQMDHWLIVFRIVSLLPWFLRSSRYYAALRSVCEYIDSSAGSDNRFRDLRWFTRLEFESLAGPTKPMT